MEIELKIEDVRVLWTYHKDLLLIAEESIKAEKPEVPIVHFVTNGGLTWFMSWVLKPLNIPSEAINIFNGAIDTLKKSVEPHTRLQSTEEYNINVKKTVLAFEHFYKIVKMLTENICYSDGLSRTKNWRETIKE
jgi:hypothetical protein